MLTRQFCVVACKLAVMPVQFGVVGKYLLSEGGTNMLVSVQGIYRHGKIELIEQPGMMRDETRVVVTFLESGLTDLQARGIAEKQAAELRARLATFAEDWDSPEMSIYDNYDAAKVKL